MEDVEQGEYFKYVITDKEYGVSILWDEEVKKRGKKSFLISFWSCSNKW